MRVSKETREATRLGILKAAAHLFIHQGFDKATTRDIAIHADIATGTLFNYFPTKEAIAVQLISEALERGRMEFQAKRSAAASAPETGDVPLDEDLFLFVWTGLRHLLPYRKFIVQALSGVLSPLARSANPADNGIRARNLETVAALMAKHGTSHPSAVAMQLYWSLYLGVLAHWTEDESHNQEETVALLDQSLILLVSALQNLSRTSATGFEENAEVNPDGTIL